MKKLVAAFLFVASFFVLGNNKISIAHKYSNDGFAQIKVTNKTNEHLACHIVVDGYKIKFTLRALRASKWYQATDKRFKATSFSTWCANIEHYPDYLKYATTY